MSGDDWGTMPGERDHDPEDIALLRQENARLRELMPPATEQVAQWMIKNGYATGHGDTVADLLGELEWQAKERGDPTQDGPR